jgi:hypothetical protein
MIGKGRESKKKGSLRYCADIGLQALRTTAKNLWTAGLRNEVFTWDILNKKTPIV